ncbi:MAG: hypothetical protein IPO86_07310 [Saprospiraceae bacterium]|nr:hypothetical protein [Saprospiraceae bacterium]MBK9222177.1 hypothetical protein [Saprospiraceae bacterium]MBK9727907.1 hypothetical protein [Saprospiraceae bacterium]
MKSYILILSIFISLNQFVFSQDLLSELGEETNPNQKVTNAFKSPRVINSHSMEMLAAGALDFRILHRFGNINEGYKQFFGLDNATMRMGFDYGITKNITVGLGRSTFKKELDGFLRYRILWQSTGAKSMPVSVVWTSGFVRNGEENPLSDRELKVTFERRMSYYHQLIIGRKFTERISAQISPTVIHTNIVNNELIPNDLLAIGIGGRFKFTKRMAFVIDYAYPMNNFPRDLSTHPLSIGIDIETGGHVFQLHFSNATGMNERAFINEENGKWLDGDIQFGFNLSRVFQIKKNKI